VAIMPRAGHAHARAAYDISAQDPKSWDHIAHCTAGHELVYRLFDRSGCLLYIGITWSAGVRWRAHRKKHAWWSQVARVEVECWGSDFFALTAELAAIKAERPKYNKRGAL
jgi:hypothetical protein